MILLLVVIVVEIQIVRDLPDHMSPYVFFIEFNDTTFIPYNTKETSHVKTHFSFTFAVICSVRFEVLLTGCAVAPALC